MNAAAEQSHQAKLVESSNKGYGKKLHMCCVVVRLSAIKHLYQLLVCLEKFGRQDENLTSNHFAFNTLGLEYDFKMPGLRRWALSWRLSGSRG